MGMIVWIGGYRNHLLFQDIDIHYVGDNRDNNNNTDNNNNNNNNNNIEDDNIYCLDTYVINSNNEDDDDDDDNNNNDDFFSQLKTLTTEDNDIYRITNYVNNKHNNKNKNKNKNENKNIIFHLINTKTQAIQYIIDNIKLELKININKQNIIKDKLVDKTLSNEKKIKF
jgi:hypothetical protein